MMKIYKFIIPIFFLFCGFVSAQESYNSLVFEGNQDFNKKKYEDSSTKFLDAVKAKDKDFTSHYNLGNSFYKRKMFDEARAEYQKADQFAKTLEDKMAAQYNIGNSYMESKQPEKAAEYYKKALKQDPYNESAQRNYQIAKLKQKEKQAEKNDQNKSGGKGGDQKNDQKNKEGKGKNPSQESGGNIQNNKGNGADGNEPNKKNEEGKMPKDLENAILNRAENQERETAKRILNQNANSMPQSNEKDW